ncbi:hypothetical protein Trco_008002 [Trichoderma cornu-damae]|uniref:Peptidase C14 caspase domain-containing protein n=1 Tax=Trichoderma cornu-damae TaxID=654480 RepID=A0A9P8QIJ4_9HYPO|nr:hypothetical protein Trco_008002 [Trichoderma cornu-damae]
MADPTPLRARHWAVLIGLDFYVNQKCLGGAVRDVSNAKEYLEAGPEHVDIAMLTATAPRDPGSRLPLEDGDSWPTRANVKAKLERVIRNARAGELVYIHYSGHGARRGCRNKFAHPSGNVAFVLFEADEHGESYFMGLNLAYYIDQMVKRGLLVTLVLDCCFSGSVLRTDGVRGLGVRSVDYDPAVEAASSSALGAELLGFCSPRGSFRDFVLPRDQWLVNPDGYTILSACGPHETAHELELGTGERRGALSYFLMEALHALRMRNAAATNESLYEHMRVRFHASWPQQTPMRYGNTDFSFFGGPAAGPSTSLVRVYVRDGSLRLDAGEAHGVHRGDRYVLRPPGPSMDGVGQPGRRPITARADAVRCLTSSLAQIEPEEAEREIRSGWKEGWQAKPVDSLSHRKISVRLLADVATQSRRDVAPEDERYLHLCTSERDTKACMYNVVVNDRGDYEILDGSMARIDGLPAIPSSGGRGAGQSLMDTLRHVSKFKYAEGIENATPDGSFEDTFSLVASVDGGKPGNLRVFDVRHGDTWRLEIQNKSKAALYLALFDFTPSWKVQNLLLAAGDSGFRVVEPDAKVHLPLKMKVPESLQAQHRRRCEDVIKVFITSRATSFPSLILPSLSSLREEHHRGGVHEADDALSKLVADLTASARGDDDDARPDKWATRSFVIRTNLEEQSL